MNVKKIPVQNPVEFSDTPLAFRLSVVAKQYYGAAYKHFENLNLERNYFMLNFISKHNHITQQVLADSMHKDKTAIVHVVDYLSEKGLVRREPNPEDRREHRIVVTKKAITIIKKISTGFENLNEKAFSGFNKKEKKQFAEMMERIEKNVSKMPSDDYSFQFIKRKK